MTFLGIVVIVTGTAMCVAGWYLSPDEFLPNAVVGSPNVTDADGQLTSVLEVSVEIPPARGLAYAGPVVMSFGCFAVVFACVVVCETRDRVLETMDDRVRRGLPARPPGGIDADFYALVVEFRKRRVEKQRRRRKLLRRDDDDDEDRNVDDCATSPLQPTPSTADIQSPSTINDFVEDHGDDAQPTSDQRLPTVRLEVPEEMTYTAPCNGSEELATLECSINPTFPDDHSPRLTNVEPQPDSAEHTHPERQVVGNLSLSWKPATTTHGSSRSSLSFDNEVFSVGADPPCESTTALSLSRLSTTEDDQQRVSTSSQLSFPLLAPISSMAQTPTLPYVHLEAVSVSTQPTYLVHTASVHAIADRSPDVLPQPDMTSFEFPPTDFRRSCDVTTSGNSAVVSDDVNTASGTCNSETYPDVESRLVADGSDKIMVSNFNVCDLERPGDVEQVRGEKLCSFDRLAASSVTAVVELPSADVANQTKRRHCNPNVDFKQLTVADRLPSSDDSADKCPDLSSRSPNDGGPSRKRSRGSTVQPQQQVHSSPGTLDDDSASLSRLTGCAGAELPSPCTTRSSPSRDYLITGCSTADHVAAADAFGSRPLYRSPGHDPRNTVCPRRRRPNGIRHFLTVQRRRRRPDRSDFAMSSPTRHVFTLPRQNSDADADRSFAAEHHSADELETFLCPTSSVDRDDGLLPRGDGRTNRDDETSPLIWLRRRTTTTTTSPQRPCRQTGDPFQSTV